MNIREEIKIFWEGPFKIDDILNNKIDKKYDVNAKSQGLYQIYGSHPLYGNDVLVYIGRTKNINGFQSRLKGRWVIENGSDSENVNIYLGTIFSDSKKLIETNLLIDKAEVLLINAMKPAYNSSNIQSTNESFVSENFILHNEGNYKNLYPVLDSKYFWQTYKNFAIINNLAETYALKGIIDEEEYYGFDIAKDEFNIPMSYGLWFGVEYKEWETNKIPLELQVIPIEEDKKNIDKIKESIKGIKYKKFDDEEINNYFQIEFNEDFFELESNEMEEVFKKKVIDIVSLIK